MAEDDRKEAATHVAMQFKQQQADQIAEHNRQTSRLRLQHRQQVDLYWARVDAVIDQYKRDIEALPEPAKEALKQFDAKRATLMGRAVEFAVGKTRVDSRRFRLELMLTPGHDRAVRQSELSGFIEATYTTRPELHRRHAQERLDMMKAHRQARLETQQQHERDRPRLVAERQKAVERNAEIDRGHKQERTNERRL